MLELKQAYARAERRLRESATPLYSLIMDKLAGVGPDPLGPGTLTQDFVRVAQKPGLRGYAEVSMYEPPARPGRRNKFTKLAASNFTGAYPRHMLTPEGVDYFYDGNGALHAAGKPSLG